MREIKDKYESQIAELDGAINEGVEKEEIEMIKKYEKQYDEQVEEEKKKLRNRL